MVKKKLLKLDEMESVARDATRRALSEYPEPSEEEQASWVLGKFEQLVALRLTVGAQPKAHASD